MLNHPSRSGSADARLLPSTAVVLCSAAALVLTSYFLGASWLAKPLLGLPLGLWFVAATYTVWRRGWLNLLDLTLPAMPRVTTPKTFKPMPLHLRTSRRLAHIARAALVEVARSLWHLEPITAESLKARIARFIDAKPELAEPLTIALQAKGPLTQAIRDHDSVVPLKWIAISPDDSGCAAESSRHDVTFIPDPAQGGRAITAETPDHSATWFDWSRPRPLAYPSVFPHQIDPACISFASLPDSDQHDPLIGALLVAAAVQSRSPMRLTLADRIRGRLPLDGHDQPGLIDPGAYTARSMTRIADLLIARNPDPLEPAQRIAASALSAFLVTPAARLSIGARRAIMERVCPYIADRPEAWLRLAALRFADMDDQAALEALHHADPLVRAHAEELVLDQIPFVQSELDHGSYDPLALGRVAAGLCLIAAQHEYSRLTFLKDDLVEDLSFVGWLVGRDPDTALLHRVLDELLRVRRADSRGLPASDHDSIAA